MNRHEQLYNIFWVFLSIMVCILSFRMQLWSNAGPEGGFMPFCAGLIMGISGLSMLILRRVEKHNDQEQKDVNRILYVLLGFCAMAYFMPILGFILSSIIVLSFLFLLTHRQRWKTSITVALIFSISFHFLFKLFQIQLPKGIFDF